MDQELAGRRKSIERERRLFDADPSSSAVDPVLLDSWVRCAGGFPMGAPPPDGNIAERWEASPIRRSAPELLDEIQLTADDGDLVATITDGTGTLMWAYSGRDIPDRAAAIDGAVGSRFDEATAGTNAVAMALITDRPYSVFSAEHWSPTMHELVCYSAPVRDAAGGHVGTINLSSPWDRANPLGLSTVAAMARLVEHQIDRRPGGSDRARWAAPAHPRGPRPVHVERTSLLEVAALGPGAVRMGGTPLLLTPRQVELVVILACTGGLTLDELHTHLHGERRVSLTTTKVDVSRLRGVLGGGVLGSRPYRLRLPVAVDVLRLMERLQRGDLAGAVALYTGQVLPRSDAPFIVEQRHLCDVALRTAVMESGSAADLLAFATVNPYDIPVMEAAVERSRTGEPIRAAAMGRLAVALDELA